MLVTPTLSGYTVSSNETWASTWPASPVFAWPDTAEDRSSSPKIFLAAGVRVRVAPNPANNLTTFEWQLPADAHAMLYVSDVQGKTVARFDLNGQLGRFAWDTTPLPSGLYCYRLLSEGRLLAIGKVIVQH